MNFKFCPSCGHKDSVKPKGPTRFDCRYCGFQYYNNPRGATAVVLIKDNQALYSKRKFDPDIGKYEFPGGFLEYGEDADQGCVREIKEEMGLVIDPIKLHLLDVYTSEYMPGISTVDLIYLLLDWEGEPTADDDVESLEWKPLSFINDSSFIRPYIGLQEKIEDYMRR